MAEERHKRFTKKRVALCAAVLFAAVIGLLVANHDSTPMPVYKGRTARDLLGDVLAASNAGETDAFEHMGSNAVPFLVHELNRKNSHWERFARWLYPKLPSAVSSHLHMPLRQPTRWGAAAIALEQANSRTAIPALTNLLTHSEDVRQSMALGVLTHLLRPEDTNCIPVLTNCLRSTDVYFCIEAARALQRVNAEKLAVAALTNFVTSADWHERLYLLDSLRYIDAPNSNKWHQMLTNDPGWIAINRPPSAGHESTTNAAPEIGRQNE